MTHTNDIEYKIHRRKLQASIKVCSSINLLIFTYEEFIKS